VRTENGEEMVDEINWQEGWTSKEVTLDAVVDLKSYSKVE
jgi:hypothetical protein